jgi:hypothetical protein
MLVSVTFYVCMREVWMLQSSVGWMALWKKKAGILKVIFFLFQREAVWMSSYDCSGDINEQRGLWAGWNR